MNILFYTLYEVSPQKGGTERITSTISKILKEKYKHKCYSIYSIPLSNNYIKTSFDQKEQISFNEHFKENIYKFINQNKIDFVINQGVFIHTKALKQAVNRTERCKLLTTHHFSPGSEELFFNRHHIKYITRHNFFKYIIKELLYPIEKIIDHNRNVKSYNDTYKYSDYMILLSPHFKQKFIEYAKINNYPEKFYFIPNSLSFNYFFNIEEYKTKEKEVLIVSRLDESHKRISLALKIWKEIEKINDIKQWKLTIVGHGEEYENEYKTYVNNNHLKRVKFVGLQQPEIYYKRASIFMMTSISEGWGLTLTEAQQFGVVPIAFESYASISDIITNYENGILIEENNCKAYIDQLHILMTDNHMRERIAQNAVLSSKRFEINTIAEKWNYLLNNLKHQNS